MLLRRSRLTWVDVWLLGMAAGYLLVHAGPGAGARVAVPLLPVVAVYAARGLAAVRPSRLPAAAA